MNDEPNQTQNNQAPTASAQPDSAQPKPAQSEPIQSEPILSTPTTTTANAAPASIPEVASTPNETAPKKKHTGLIVSIIIIVIVLLGGGGTFAALVIMNSSPASMLMSSFNNLVNSKQIATSGTVEFTPKNLSLSGIKSFNLGFDAERVDANQRTEASLTINYVDGTSTNILNFGDIMLQNGILYLHIDGINDFYQNNIRSIASSNIEDLVKAQYRQNLYANCRSTASFYDCYSNASLINPETQSLIKQKTTKLLSSIDNIVKKIDGQWFELSIENILNNDFLSQQLSIPNVTRQGIISSYNCTIDVLGHPSKYSDEFSNLYSQYPYINITPAQDNYYDISIDDQLFSNYANNLKNLNFYKDVASCLGIDTATSDTSTIDYAMSTATNSIELNKKYLPNVAVRFGGLIDHHLTDVKVSQSNDYYNLSANIKLTYPSNLQISAPSNPRPIMDLVQEVYTTITTALQN